MSGRRVLSSIERILLELLIESFVVRCVFGFGVENDGMRSSLNKPLC